MTSAHLPSAVGVVVFKVVCALLVVALGSAWLFVQLRDSLVRDDVVDLGNRGLVVIGSSGGKNSYNLRVLNKVRSDGSLDMFISFTGARVKYGQSFYDGFAVRAKIAFLGDSMKSVTCGKARNRLPGRKVSAMDVGLRAAVHTDANGGSTSARNFRGSRPLERYGDTKAYVYSQRMVLLREGDERQDRTLSADGSDVFTEVCHIPEDAIWSRAAAGAVLGRSDRRTLLLPQFNWTSIGPRTKHLDKFRIRTNIERTHGMTLAESYPALETYDGSFWYRQSSVWWSGRLGERSNIGYSDQPVYIFDQRANADRQALFLTFAGTLLGVIATLVLYVASRLIDLVVALVARRSDPDAE